METYNGHVRTPGDAIILFEACRIGLLPRVQRRLSEKERQSIKSGSVFVWDEREAGMRRWTDGKSWSASRVSGSFLTYREMEGKRGGSQFDKNANRDGMQNNNPPEADSDGGPDGYRYKPDGLMKQSFSIVTNNGQHLHLISYYSRSSQQSAGLMQPTSDPQLRHIRPEKGMYPESTVHEQSTIPAVTRGPMSSPGYTHSPHPSAAYPRGPYGYPPHPNAWAPPSPMHTPPPHPHYGGYYQHPGHPGYGHPLGIQYPPHGQYPSHMNAFDRPPPHLQNPALPPPPHHYGHIPPHAAGYGAPYGQPYPSGYGSYQPPPLQTPSYPPPSQQPAPFNSRPAPPPAAPLPEANAAPKDDRHDSQQSQLKSPAQSDSDAQAQAGAAQASTTQAAAPVSTQTSNSTIAAPASSTAPTATPAAAPANSGQTIPSIHTMLSNADGNPPVRSSSRSPNGTLRIPSDIPSHKLGFEANRDMQALRNLDKTTFKAY